MVDAEVGEAVVELYRADGEAAQQEDPVPPGQPGPGTIPPHRLLHTHRNTHTNQYSVVDPDPHGSGTFAWIQIRNYSSGSSKKL